METFLRDHGLLAVGLAAIVERDLAGVFAGMIAHSGFFPVVGALLAVTFGSFAADLALFFTGRKLSGFVQRSRRLKGKDKPLRSLAKRFGGWAIPLSQFFYGVRATSMVMWGLVEPSAARFAVFDFLGCVLLTFCLVALGLFMHETAVELLGEVQKWEGWILAGALSIPVVLLMFRAVRFVLSRRSSKRTQ